jgi:hypothetical protein
MGYILENCRKSKNISAENAKGLTGDFCNFTGLAFVNLLKYGKFLWL